MNRSATRHWLTFAATLIGLTATAGCMPQAVGGSSTQGRTYSTSIPATATRCVNTGPGGSPGLCVGWAEPGAFYVVTWGASNCRHVPYEVTSAGADRVSVSLTSDGGPPCTPDYVPTTSRREVPEGVVDTSPVTFMIAGESIVLPARR